MWVFGGTECDSQKSFPVPLLEKPQKDAETLLPLIQKYIKPGSTIISDEWRAYSKLSDLGYKHLTINHSENFADPVNPLIHTQNIERLWEDVKAWVLKAGIRKQFFRQYFSRYLFINSVGNPKKIFCIIFFRRPPNYIPLNPTSASIDLYKKRNQALLLQLVLHHQNRRSCRLFLR